MKIRPLFFVPLLPLLSTVALGANITWDATTGTTGAQDGTGNWNTSNTNWWNGTANASFSTGDNVTIGATTGTSTVTLETSLAVGNLTFANNGSGKACTVNLGGNSLTLGGTLTTSGNSGGYNNVLTNGTLILANASSSASTPDITKVGTSAANYGTVIGAAVNVGTGSRFITGTTDRNEVARYSGDLRFDGALSGSATLNFIGGAENNSHNMHFVLNAANSGFTGAVNLTRGDLALTNSAALSSANAVTFNAAAGTRSSLFLFGRNVTIGTLNDTSAGSRFIRNGSLAAANGGTNTANNASSVALGVDANSVLTINQTAAGTFGGVIADGPNDTGTGATGTYRTLAITKNGTATLTLNGANTYTGGTSLNQGTLAISNATGLGTGTLTVGTGTTTGIGNATGFLLVTNTAATTVANPIVLPAPAAANTLHSIVKSTSGTTTGTALTLSGNLTGGNANLTLVFNSNTASDNSTTYRLTGTNTFLGSVRINRGAFIYTGPNCLGDASNPLILDANNNQTLGDLRFEVDATLSRPIGSLSAGNTNPINTNGFNVVFNGIVSGPASFTKIGAGTLAFNALNTYTNKTIINGGTLAINTVAAGGLSSSLGASAASAANLVFGGGTLSYTGSTATSDRGFTIGSSAVANLEVTEAATSLTLSGGTAATTGSLIKTGPGTLVLGGVSLYTGNTTVSGGTLALSGSGSIATSTSIIVGASTTFDVSGVTGGYSLGSGQTLSGTGTVVGAMTIGGTLAPGASPGDLNLADNLTLGGTLNLEVTGTTSGLFDRLVGDGSNTLTLGGTLNLNNTGYTATLGDEITVFSGWGSISGAFASVTGTDLGGGLSWDTSGLATLGKLSVIPEPAAALLGGLGLLTLLRRRR